MPENPVFEPENSVPILNNQLSRRSLLAVGAVAAAALTLPALPARAGDFPYSDIMALRFLEEIARVEADFFAKAANSSTAEGIQERELSAFSLIARQDSELVRWFKAARQQNKIGAFTNFYTPNQSTSRPTPTYSFGTDTFDTRSSLYSTAISIKETALGVFHSVVGDADSPKMIQAFAALAGVQGRHAAILRELSGQSPLVPFEATVSRNTAAQRFEAYGFNREVLG
jgi:hypothetical protein